MSYTLLQLTLAFCYLNNSITTGLFLWFVATQMLQQTMESMGYECHRRFRFYNWIHRVQGQSFEDYMARRPSRVRNTIARKQRKLEREHGYTVSLYTDRHLQQALEDYNTVYRASWKANELYQGFIEGLAESVTDPGWLRLAILYIDDKPAACNILCSKTNPIDGNTLSLSRIAQVKVCFKPENHSAAGRSRL